MASGWGVPVSVHGVHVVRISAAIAKVLGTVNARAVADVRNTLKAHASACQTPSHGVPGRADAVAEACLAEGRAPYIANARVQHQGRRGPPSFKGMILKLLVRIPLRQRNLRELRLDRHLYQEAGHWHLHFSGDDLKIGHRGAQVNTYHVDLTDYCPDFLPVLKEFLEGVSPLPPQSHGSTLLFLTQGGKPYTKNALHHELSVAVALRTGQQFYPHLIRTIWATEYIEKKRDFTGAAYMLGDNVATVLRAYQDILGKDQHAKAKTSSPRRCTRAERGSGKRAQMLPAPASPPRHRQSRQ